jgi:hypothetical protein
MNAVSLPSIGAPMGLPHAKGGPTAALPLLAPPPDGNVDIGDAVTALLQVTSQLSQQQMLVGKSQVEVADGQRRAAAEQRKEAFARAVEAARKAREAAEDSGGFLSCITDHLGLEGLVGLVTGDFALVVTDFAAHETGLAGKSTNMLDLGATALAGPAGYLLERGAMKILPADFEKSVNDLGSIKDDDVRVANKIAAMVAMAVAAAAATVFSFGTAAPAFIAVVGIGISTATQIANQTGALREVVGAKAAGWVALGGAITGAALSLGASATSISSGIDTATSAADALNAVKSVGEGTDAVVSGLRALDCAKYQHRVDLADADGQEARNAIKRIETMVDGLLDDLRDAKDSAQRATETLQATLQTYNQTMLQAGAMKV